MLFLVFLAVVDAALVWPLSFSNSSLANSDACGMVNANYTSLLNSTLSIDPYRAGDSMNVTWTASKMEEMVPLQVSFIPSADASNAFLAVAASVDFNLKYSQVQLPFTNVAMVRIPRELKCAQNMCLLRITSASTSYCAFVPVVPIDSAVQVPAKSMLVGGPLAQVAQPSQPLPRFPDLGVHVKLSSTELRKRVRILVYILKRMNLKQTALVKNPYILSDVIYALSCM